jgi:sugar phosphate isomerase/epimerase
MKWEIGISTGIAYDSPIHDLLPYLSESGFRVLEICTAPQHLALDALAVRGVRDAMRAFGLRVHSLHAPFGDAVNFTSPDAAEREAALARLTLAAEALQTLGGSLYVIHPGGEDSHWVWTREAQLELALRSLHRVWNECRRRDLSLVIETPLPHLLGGQVEDFAWILERMPNEGVGVCLDTSHAFLGGHLHETIERFGPRIVHVQASDNHGHTDDHLLPGEGLIEWTRVIAGLERAHYKGVFMLEVTGQGPIAERMVRASALAGGSCPPPPGWPGLA